MIRALRFLPERLLFPVGLAIALLFLLFPADSALAAPIAVHEVGSLDLNAALASQPLLVSGRAPASQGSLAGASSMRVPQSSGEGTRTNGKIIGLDRALRGKYSCSGTALNTPSRSIVLTAGHCVVEGGSVGTDIVFIPAYNHEKRPFGTFEAESVYVPRQWRRYENPAFDVAALKVRPNQFGALTDVVGARGFATSGSRYSVFDIFGYPAAALRGEELRECRAHGLGSDSLTNGFIGPPTIPAFCDMAGGSSGGGWIVDGEYVNGVTSYAYSRRSARLYSPYFGPEIANFLRKLP